MKRPKATKAAMQASNEGDFDDEAADDDEVVLFGTQLEEVSTDRLEGIGRVLGNNWRHGRIARGKPGALSTGRSVIDEVLSEVGPVERGGSSLKHGRG